MEETAEHTDEVVLAEVSGLLHDGILATPGTLTLTEAHLQFEPTGTYQRLGMLGLSIPVASIKNAEVVGINQLLKVRSDDTTQTFSGAQIKVIGDRLASLVECQDVDGTEFQDGERVLGVFDAERPVNKLMAAEGQLVITTHRVYFQPGAVGGLVWGKTKFSTRIGEMRALTPNIRRGQLTLETDDGERVVGCNALAEVYGTLISLQDHVAAGSSPESFNMAMYRVYLHRGALAVRGIIVLTAERLSFLPSGLDRIAGSAELFQVAYRDIRVVSNDRSADNRLNLEANGVTTQFTVERFTGLLTDIAFKMSLEPGPMERSWDEEASNRTTLQEHVLDTWQEGVSTSSGPINFFEPVVFLSRHGVAQRGWLFLRGKYVHWVPNATPDSETAAITLPVRQMQSVSEELSNPTVIDFAVRGDVYRFISRLGEPAADRFWKEVTAFHTELDTHRLGEPAEHMNRRETYRVLSSADNAEVPTITGELRSGTKEPQAFEGRLIDFSFGGCAMVVKRALSKSGELFVFVNGRTESRFIRASLVYERKLRRVGGYRVGLRFQPVDSADIKLLRSAWMMMQRTVAVVRSEEYWSIFEE